MRVYERLVKLAVGIYRCDRHLAEDAAMDAIYSALKVQQFTYPYCRASMKNYIFEHYRNRKTRNEDYAAPLNEEGEPMEMEGVSLPIQHLRIEAIECANALESLPDSVREVMGLIAQEYTAEEISVRLDMPLSDVQWKTKYGRKIMRQRDGYEIERKRGHHQYIGIRKKHRLWEASIREGDNFHYLGHFKTAAAAAQAYDDKAKELFGAKAKLNFAEREE